MRRNGEKEILFGERVLLPDRFAPASLLIADGRIEAVAAGRVAGARALPSGAVLAPGFVDLQVNGGGGVLLNDDPSPAAIARIAAAHRPGGTTGLFPTLITDRPGLLGRAAEAVAAGRDLPGVLGLHAEGPFISPRRPGVHPPEWIRAMTAADEAELAAIARALPLLLTIAPEEVPADAVARLAAAGCVLSLGHTEADALVVAARPGLRGATHLWNAMGPLASRAPGPVGAVLDHDALFAGVIADGIHVEPAALRLTFRLLGPARMFLVTDAMPPAGTTDTGFLLGGRPIRRRAGRLETADGTLAGADLSMIGAVRFAAGVLGAPLADALRMASATPCAFARLPDRGVIRPGAHADLVALDAALDVRATAIGGDWMAHDLGRPAADPTSTASWPGSALFSATS
jgi:N-acetylglucosamine-6-phosphate deacetylase